VRTDLATRVLGALFGVGFTILFAAVGLAVASSDDARAAVMAVGATVLVLGGLLGFVFAPRAVKPGERSALGSSARVTAWAVPLGAMCMAALEFGRPSAMSWTEWAGGIAAVALVGILLLGLPLAGLVFLVANVWVIVLRVVVRYARGTFQARDRGGIAAR
jgi:hypothetical protein